MLATVVGAVALLVGGAGIASAAPTVPKHATSHCWLDVVNDWLDNGRVDGTYPTACYTEAIKKLNTYPDLRQYSSAPDDIHRALLAAMHKRQDSGPGSPGGGSSSSSGGGGNNSSGGGGLPSSGKGGGGGGGGGASGATVPTHKSVITRLFDAARPGSAQAIPLPLLVLAALAVLLLLAAGGTWLARRLQSRRLTPATSPAHARDDRR